MNVNSCALAIAAMGGFDSYNNVASGSSRLGCISNQVTEDLGQLPRESTDGLYRFCRETNPYTPLRDRPLGKRNDFRDELAQVDWNRFLRIAMEGERLPCDARNPFEF